MRKLLRLSLLTAVLTLVMSAAVWAEEINENTTLNEGGSYTDMVIKGSGDITITVPANGVSVNSSSTSALANGSCITIESGNVTIEGAGENAAIKYDGTKSCGALIRVNNGASLTLKNIIIDGNNPNNGNSNGKYYYGIDNKGTLTITDGTVVKSFTTVSYSKFGSGVYNEGTFNMTGGEICNNAFTLGGGVYVHNGTANISGGTIHDNTNYSIYHDGGTVTITGGLIVGNTAGKYDVSGVYKSGLINVPGTAPFVIEDRDQPGVSVTAKKGDYFVANPAHNLVATIEDLEHTAIYYQNEWHFFNAEHDDPSAEHRHELIIEETEVNMFLDEEKVIFAKVICDSGNYEVKSSMSNADSNIIDVTKTQEKDSDTTVFTLKPKKVGTAKILFTSGDGQSKKEITVNVSDPNVIKGYPDSDKPTMSSDKKYVNTTIKNLSSVQDTTGYNPLVVTVADNIKIGSTEGSNCITIEKGSVKLTGGGTITHENDGNFSSRALIKVKSGALLVLENITIDGGWIKGTEATKDLLYYGIDIEKGATVIIKSGTVIKGIDVNAEIEDDAILYNNGNLTINGGAIYDNDNHSYVIYNNGGTVTVNGGITVGNIPSEQISSIGGKGQWGVLGIKPDGTLTAKYDNDQTLEIDVSTGDYIMMGSKGTLSSTNSGIEARYNSVVHSWDFIDAINAEVSYVQGENSVVTGNPFRQGSHYTEIGEGGTVNTITTENTDEKHSVSTGFYTQVDDVSKFSDGKAYVVFDILFPRGKTLYFDSTKKVGFNNYFHDKGFDLMGNPVTDEGKNLTTAINAMETQERKGKYIVDADSAGNDTLFGVILEGVYAPDAIAYITVCTQEQYESAENYTEITDSDTAQTALIELE